MAVELSEDDVRDALAVLGEHDENGAQAAQSSLAWVGWDGEGPLALRRYDVQLFCWYTLPCKFLASIDDKREAASALARTLEAFGGAPATYAEVCRSAETAQLLMLWELDEAAARRRLRELLDSSGIEPPDTELLTWGEVMGVDEASAREHVSIALEAAVEDGRLVPGAAGFGRRQGQIADEALRDRRDDHGPTILAAVHAERLRRWIGHEGPHRAARRAILQPIAGLLADEPPRSDEPAAREALAPTLWLLRQAADGLALTQSGALSRALVREAVERWPDWWDSDLFGPPNRELDVSRLHELHHLVRRLRLVRRRGRRIVITKRGTTLCDDPPALLAALAVELLSGDGFAAACGELAAAAILRTGAADFSDDLARKVHPAILEQGWHSGDEQPDVRDVGWQVADLLRLAEAIGVLAREPRREPRSAVLLTLTSAGRAALIVGLRARALAPARYPW